MFSRSANIVLQSSKVFSLNSELVSRCSEFATWNSEIAQSSSKYGMCISKFIPRSAQQCSQCDPWFQQPRHLLGARKWFRRVRKYFHGTKNLIHGCRNLVPELRICFTKLQIFPCMSYFSPVCPGGAPRSSSGF